MAVQGIDGNSNLLNWRTLGGRSFPVQASHDLTHKNLIYHKIVIAPCPERNPSDREVRYLFSHSEEPGSGLTGKV